MPKPEPLLLIMLFGFFYFFKKNKYNLSYIFAGLSVGVKINALLVVIPFFIIEIYKKNNINIANFLERFSLVFLKSYFLFIYLGYKGLKIKFNSLSIKILSHIFSFFSLLVCLPFFYLYSSSIFGNTFHGANSELIGYSEWFEFISKIYFNSSLIFLFIFYFFFQRLF